MTPAARVQGAIEVFDRILKHNDMIDVALRAWAKENRYAGAKDRLAIADLVYSALRKRRTLSAIGGNLSGRPVLYALLASMIENPDEMFNGLGYAPEPLSTKERAALSQPSEEDLFNLPDWLLPEWKRTFGKDSLAIAQRLEEQAGVFLRVNTLQTSLKDAIALLKNDGIDCVKHSSVAGALYVVKGHRKLRQCEAYVNGWVELQDASSQESVAALPINHANMVLDYCAGAGGKTLALAAHFKTEITAHDVDPRRMRQLPQRAHRAKAQVKMSDARFLVSGSYDLVFCDVPCSGSGTWRRDPMGKWNITKGSYEDTLRRQAGILEEASNYVRKGGMLAYATCSVLTRENHAQVAAFLEGKTGWEKAIEKQTLPHSGGDGFYFCYILNKN